MARYKARHIVGEAYMDKQIGGERRTNLVQEKGAHILGMRVTYATAQTWEALDEAKRILRRAGM